MNHSWADVSAKLHMNITEGENRNFLICYLILWTPKTKILGDINILMDSYSKQTYPGYCGSECLCQM